MTTDITAPAGVQILPGLHPVRPGCDPMLMDVLSEWVLGVWGYRGGHRPWWGAPRHTTSKKLKFLRVVINAESCMGWKPLKLEGSTPAGAVMKGVKWVPFTAILKIAVVPFQLLLYKNISWWFLGIKLLVWNKEKRRNMHCTCYGRSSNFAWNQRNNVVSGEDRQGGCSGIVPMYLVRKDLD